MVKKLSSKELILPVPRKYIEQGNILAYGYNRYFFFETENLPANGNLLIKSNWLVCKHICIPGEGTIEDTYTTINLKLINQNSQVKNSFLFIRGFQQKLKI